MPSTNCVVSACAYYHASIIHRQEFQAHLLRSRYQGLVPIYQSRPPKDRAVVGLTRSDGLTELLGIWIYTSKMIIVVLSTFNIV